MAMNLDALLRIKASVSGEREIQRLGNSMQGVTGKVKNLQMAFAALGGTIVVADAARRYFQGFNEAEKAAAAVRTLGVDSKTLSAQLLNVSNRLGGLYSQTQLLAASYDVASAGFANAADNAKILEVAAKGATGGLSDINTVGNAVTSVLNAYGKSADQAAALVDGFIQTQNDGKIVLDQYAQQIGRLAPSAAASGVGINELNAAIATITAQGVPVEATFAGLNQALIAILKPSKEASDLAAELGIQFNETGLRTKGFGGLLDEVKQKTGGSTTALVQLFGGVDALKAILPLVNDDLVKYNKNLANQANASGVAEDATSELGGTVSSEISKMINQIGNLTRSLDTVLGPALGGIVRLINFVIAEATRGIQVLGQLFSMSPNATLAKQAVAAGQLGNVGRVLPGIDELIGEKRRKELQRKAGAGTGLFGLGMSQSKFIELLQGEPAFKQAVQPQIAKQTATIDSRIQAILDGLGEGGSKKSSKKGKSEADKAAQQEARLQSRLRGLQIETQGTLQLALIKGKIAEAEMAGNKELAISLQGDQRRQQILLDLQRSLEGITDERERQALLTKAQAELESAGMDTAIEMERRRLEVIKEQNDELFKRAGFAPQDKMRGGAGTFDPSLPDLRVSPAEQQMAKYREELAALTNPINMAVTGADAIGNAFGQAFQDIATGAKSTQEALADAFKGIGEAFIQMATQIIAKQLAMIAFQTILKALGGGGGGFSFSGAGPAALPSGDGFAAGFSMPPLLPGRANGGPVTSGSPYLVGERGPELFVPSSSGSVMSNADTRAALAEQSAARSTNDTRAMLEQQTAARQANATGMALQQKPIDVRYESTVINQTEYVTAEQHRKGLAQAAERGRALTLAALQNSTRTRKKVGI